MRRNLLIGLCLMALVSLAAGDYVFNRLSGAQDAPKKAEPDEQKNDLFELLKKELDGKKDPVALPPLGDLPKPGGLIPVAAQEKPSLPPVVDGVSVNGVPVTSDAQEKPSLPPVVDAPKPGPLPLPATTTGEPKQVAPQGPSIPAPTPIMPPQTSDPVAPPSNNGIPPIPGVAPPALRPVKVPEKLVEPPTEIRNEAPGYPKQAFDPSPEPVKPKQDSAVKPAIGTDQSVTPRTNVLPPATTVAPSTSAALEPIKTKTSPWTLHIEIVDDMTVVTATVNKKHEFKVVCQNLEVQTGKDAFKASGKVKITGDSINGTCDRLAISLTDDRLVLEGGAEVQIQKTITQVSSDDGKPAAFELKGETLNLRISELQSGKFTQASFRKVENEVPVRAYATGPGTTLPTVPAAPGSKEWSPYGKLRRVDGNWRLEDNAGRTILRLETANGQMLDNYNGRTVSVFGPVVDRMTVRVTHIAVP